MNDITTALISQRPESQGSSGLTPAKKRLLNAQNLNQQQEGSTRQEQSPLNLGPANINKIRINQSEVMN